MVYGMKDVTIVIDEAGRLVLPKPIRDAFRLRAGSRLHVEPCGDHLRLRPVEVAPALVQVDGWWVHQGSPDSGDELTEAVTRHRHERLDDASR